MGQHFGRRLQARMADHYVAAIDLARELSVSPATVGRWLRGTSNPRPEDVETLVRVFGAEVATWLDWQPPTDTAAGQLDQATLDRLAQAHRAELMALPEVFRAAVLSANARPMRPIEEDA
jgi:transcriptional regulator with XRE-family HTH domain